MQTFSRTPIKVVVWVAATMIAIVVLHIGGTFALRVGQFAPLTGALIGSSLALVSACLPRKLDGQTEPWIGFEQLCWMLIGLGMLFWTIGEGFWRYYIFMGQTPFPSQADIGYSLFPALAFIGLLLLPAPDSKSRRIVLVMDSLISMGSLLSIAWYLLLGSLAQAPGEANLAKFLGLYYPTSDIALLSCIVFLLLRGQQGSAYQATARRVSLLVVGLGVCFFVGSDFVFNIQQNAGTYIEATWSDLGWPLGMMTMGVAAYLRRFLPATPSEVIERRLSLRLEYTASNPFQFVPYILLGLLLFALSLNVLSSDTSQQAIRPVLLFATLSVIVLVVVRQILTLWDNMLLTYRQAEALEHLARVNQRVEEQSHHIAEHNAELERGIEHLCKVHASLANGDLRARAALARGPLMPLAGSLNLMAERLTRMAQSNLYAQRLTTALKDLSIAFERHMAGATFVIPPSCEAYVEIHHLLTAMRMKAVTPLPTVSRPLASPLSTSTSPPKAPAALTSPSSPSQLPVTQPLMSNQTTRPFPASQHAQQSRLQTRRFDRHYPSASGISGLDSSQERR